VSEWFETPRRPNPNDPPETGLRFECTMCGNCCTGPPGFVHFTEAEARAMAGQLGLEDAEFRARYTHSTPVGPSLREVRTKHGYDCIFLKRDDGKATCSVYESRPLQCRTWPFWKSNLKSERNWQSIRRTCPGVDQGPLHSPEFIKLTRDRLDI
jgi:Fe-S-cluster containining protein